MPKFRTVAAVAAILAVAGCSRQAEVEAGPTPEEGNAVSYTANIQAQGQHGHSGSLNATSSPEETRVTVNLSGGSEGGTHPWHIHQGTCGSGGGIVGEPTAYPVLNVDSSGNASATANLGVFLMPGQSYHVNIHQSRSQMSEIVGCGELRVQ